MTANSFVSMPLFAAPNSSSNFHPPSLPVAVMTGDTYRENGRDYHSFRRGMYMFPCDEKEKDRLDMFHKFFLVARRDSLHSAPVPRHNARILDLGCGTGIWSIDMAEHLKPGYGYFEQVEIDLEPRCDDGTLPSDSSIRLWYDALKQATARAGKPIQYQHDTRDMLESAGFIDINETVIRVPYNTWPVDPHQKEIARWYNVGMVEALQALSLAPFTRVNGWNVDDIDGFLNRVKSEIRVRRLHGYNKMYGLL
ncbi:MAG: hypothetical protein M1820_005684 [Bogoriella megaspora]|nr:MAG: hypothetical protein M1820_005684 [Bogoriella megaspora]